MNFNAQGRFGGVVGLTSSFFAGSDVPLFVGSLRPHAKVMHRLRPSPASTLLSVDLKTLTSDVGGL